LFYLFDYQLELKNNPLKRITDFKFINSIPEDRINLDPEQIRKYYVNIEEGDFDRNSPFPSAKIISLLDSNLKTLGIDRGKLKPIPNKYLS